MRVANARVLSLALYRECKTWVEEHGETPANLLKAKSTSAARSFSQELVQPRFPDRTAVETTTGFGTLNNSQIASSSGAELHSAGA